MPKFMQKAFGMMYELSNQANDIYDTWLDGKWARDSAQSNMATAYYLRCYPEVSTIDLIRLHAGQDGWTLATGQGGHDVIAGRM